MSLDKANKINSKIKNGQYPVQELRTADLINARRIQVKSLANVDNTVVNQIAERYEEDLFSPVTVVTNGDDIILVDGNHRAHAKMLLKHAYTPAYVIPFKDLDYDEHMAYYLGCARQVNPLVAKELNDNDIKNLIMKDLASKVEIQSENYYSGLSDLTEKPVHSIRLLVSSVMNTRGRPMRPWSKQEASNYAMESYGHNEVYHSCSVKEYTRGIGTVIEAMAQNSVRYGVLVLYHPRTDSVSNYQHVPSTIKSINESMGIEINLEILALRHNEEYAHG